jgi:protein-L-isoaspartate(D-aspartate) O-methyltransferase
VGRIRLKSGDGSGGWPHYAPFDKILVAAVSRELPRPLVDQLVDGGMLIAPIVEKTEHITLITKRRGTIDKQRLIKCSFVPLLKGVG